MQIEGLRSLEEGWYDSSGTAYQSSALDWLLKLSQAILDGFQLPTPYVYPTPEGAARLEWPARSWEVVAIFDLEGRTADVLAARVDSDEIHELTVPFADVGAESHFGRFVAEHLQPR